MSKLLLIGGGGHCKSVLDSLLSAGGYSAIGVVEKTSRQYEDNVLGVPVVGWDGELPELYQKGYTHAFVTVGHIDQAATRRKLTTLLLKTGFVIPNIIDPSAVVSSYATLRTGIFVGRNAVINAGSVIGDGVIINTSAIIEHDCQIKDFVHIAPGVVLCGAVTVGPDSLIGANSTIKQQIHIGSSARIGMGSTVVSDIPDNALAVGVPAKVISPIT